MAAYTYKALSSDGKQVTGSVHASTEAEARQLLNAGSRLYIIDLKLARGGAVSNSGKPSDAVFYDFVDDLVAFLKSGVPVLQSLISYSSITQDKKLKNFLSQAIEGISRGQSFSAICDSQSNSLDELFLINVKTGEETGNLAESLEEYQQFLKTKIRIRRKMMSLIAYPAFLMVTLMVILALMFYLVLPSFINLFIEQGTQLPGSTRALITISENFHWVALAGVAGVFLIRTLQKYASPEAKSFISGLIVRIPVYGKLKTLLAQFRFVRTLHSLTRVGVTVTDSIKVILNITDDFQYQKKLAECLETIQSGLPLTEALTRSRVLEEKHITMLSAAEETGQLDQSLQSLSEKILEGVELKVEVAMRLLEPILVLVIGLVVGFTVLAMYLPIFSISDLVY